MYSFYALVFDCVFRVLLGIGRVIFFNFYEYLLGKCDYLYFLVFEVEVYRVVGFAYRKREG